MAGLGVGVEKFGKAGVVGDGVEVGVIARQEAILGVQADGLSEVFDALFGVAGHACEQGEAVEGVVGGVMIQKDGVEVLARVLVVPVIEERDGVIVSLFVRLEGGGAFVDLRDTGGDVHADALGEIGWGIGEHLQKGFVCLIEFTGLHELEGRLVKTEGGLAGGV